MPQAANALSGDEGRGPSSLVPFVRDFAAHAGGKLGYTAVLLAGGAILEGAGLLLLLPILSVAIGSTPGDEWLGSFTTALVSIAPAVSPFGQLVFLLILFAVVMAIRAAVILARDVTLARLQVDFVEWNRLETIRLLTNTRWDVVSRLRHGRITHVLGGDVQACGDAVSTLLHSTVAAAMLAVQSLLVLLLSPLLALLVFALLVGGALALRPVVRRARDLGAALTDANLHLVTATTQFLGGLKLALSQNLEAGFLRGFEATLKEAASRRIKFARQRTSVQLWLTAAAAFVAGAAILVGVGVMHAAPSTLIAFLFVLARMNGPGIQLQAGLQNIFHSLPAYGKIKQLQSELAAAQTGATPAAAPLSTLAGGDIEFRDVSFWHEDREPSGDRAGGIFDVTLAIRQASFLGLVGPSGAGKSTFADLLVGLYPPRKGEIIVGGALLSDAALRSWREQVSYVSQDPFLFHDSIRQNLLWARPDAQEADLWEALCRCGADGLVRSMEHGLDTVVGERGTLLSGGERQRIALARALLRRPRLLVLDEATNAIDIEGERKILEDLREGRSAPTILMIAHRQSSLDLCDYLIELRNGRVVSGTGLTRP
ncbi:MAG: ABC transporter ATP-binding protein/permease [Pseudomonadota bacterium]|nr:ABC transporter ATP-binding protein/permease [Pseudomonadota bacterium]